MTATTIREPRAGSGFYPGLAALRGIAAVGVVVTHVAFWTGSYGQGFLGAMSHRLEVGVPLFFVLSGFLLARPYYASMLASGSWPRTRGYAVKRFTRVYPVYLLAVVVALAVIPENRELGGERWWSSLLGVDYYRGEPLPHGLSQMWSLYVEVAFYAALPVLMLALRAVPWASSVRFHRVVLAVLSIGSVLWVLGDGSEKMLPAYALWFTAGMYLGLLEVWRRYTSDPDGLGRLERSLVHLASLPGTCWLIAFSAFVIVSTPIAGPPALAMRTTSELTWRLVMYAIVAFVVVLPSVFGRPESRYARVLAHPLLQRLGLLSYSIFCLHLIVLEWGAPLVGFELFRSSFPVLLVCVLVCSVVLAQVVYWVVERPAIAWGHGRAQRLTARQDVSAASTDS